MPLPQERLLLRSFRDGAGEKDGGKGKEGGHKKNQRRGAYYGRLRSHGGLFENDGSQKSADTVAQKKSQWDSHNAQKESLLADNPAKLPGCDADGL